MSIAVLTRSPNIQITEAQGALVTAAVQIGSRLYMVEEFFADAQPGNRTQFPFVDITEKVDALLK
jgi:hypothetical protein